MYYVYVLYGKRIKKFYVGYSSDLRQRLKDHIRGNVHTTEKMSDGQLVYYEACISKKDALIRKKQLKTGFGRGYLKRRLKYTLDD